MRGTGGLRTTVGLHKPRRAPCQNQHERNRADVVFVAAKLRFVILDPFFFRWRANMRFWWHVTVARYGNPTDRAVTLTVYE